MTIPLRSCCEDCIHITEESLKEGVEWREKFSRAARRRRRSASLDSAGFVGITPSESGSSFSTKRGLNVDEMDKRQHSLEIKREDKESVLSSDNAEDAPRSSKETPRVSPIEEEDDDQLFPLPSPRRTPISSPVPSPNASTSCLAASASRDSLPISAKDSTVSSGEDSESRVRKPRCGKGLLTPDSSPSIPEDVPVGLQLQEYLLEKATQMPVEIPASPTSLTSDRTSSPERKRRRASLGLPTPTQFFKAGADVIKGVGAMGGASPVHV
jgi:hypothetical protein